MSEAKFLIEANALILPYERYYSTDIVPSFWETLHVKIADGTMAMLDVDKEKIKVGKNKLSSWLSEQDGLVIYRQNDEEIIRQTHEVLEYVHSCDLYKDSSKRAWEDDIGNALLIATAKVKELAIVTFETPAVIKDSRGKCDIKIPDIAKHFDVRTEDLFYMMRTLGISV